jgi:hypothetical protein
VKRQDTGKIHDYRGNTILSLVNAIVTGVTAGKYYFATTQQLHVPLGDGAVPLIAYEGKPVIPISGAFLYVYM